MAMYEPDNDLHLFVVKVQAKWDYLTAVVRASDCIAAERLAIDLAKQQWYEIVYKDGLEVTDCIKLDPDGTAEVVHATWFAVG